MIVGAVASGASASSTGDGSRYGTQPGFGVASARGSMHGAFDYFGKGLNLSGGADGQQTGLNNSAKGCQRNF
jgi:hypothetical protein